MTHSPCQEKHDEMYKLHRGVWVNSQEMQSEEKGNPNQTTQQLTTEDYESIWLRVKEKGKYWVIGWVSFIVAVISALSAVGVSNYISNSIDTNVQKYIASREFKTEADSVFQIRYFQLSEKFNTLLRKTDSLENSIKEKTILLKSFPYKVNETGFSFVDSTGKKITVEYGIGRTNRKVFFKGNYLSNPIVVASFYIDDLGISPYSYFKADNSLVITDVDKEFFQASEGRARLGNSPKFFYIAIGE